MEDILKQHTRGREAQKMRLHHGADFISLDIECDVLNYLLEERAKGIPVSNLDLKEKAMEIAKSLPQTARIVNFKASDGWVRAWKKRNRIALLRGTNDSQKIPADYGELLKDFTNLVKEKRRQNDYTFYNIGMKSIIKTYTYPKINLNFL